MLVLSFLVQLIGATFLLLFAVRMVRTGIERAFGASFRRLVTGERSILQLVPVGVLLAILLQSSAAVTLLVAGFASSGTIAFASGLAVVLGGDLGSALIIQVLSLELDWLVPVLLTAGGVLFLKCSRRSLRQAGRITLGIAFILIALGLLREAVEPIRESAFLPAISSYLERDFVTAFIVGAALAFVMHSSVAAVLMCVAIVGAGALPMTVGASIVLGANLGSSLIPIWLSRGMAPEALRIPVANLLIRGGAGAVAVAVVNYSSVLSHLGEFGGMGVAQSLVLLHILFNAMLLLALPICGRLENPINAFLPGPPEDPDQPAHHRSVLDEAALQKPHLAIACLRREVLRMSGIIGDMLSPVMDLYASFDKPRMEAIKAQDKIVNEALDRIRVYAADMRLDEMTKDQRKDSRALLDYAIALEAAGDVVVKRLLPLAESKSQNGSRFSERGGHELRRIHRKACENLTLASNVLVSSDVEGARLLLEGKAAMAKLERSSRKKHLKRLHRGDVDSFSSSDIHLETAYSLKELNSWIVTVAHPILDREGLLLTSRLAHGDAES